MMAVFFFIAHEKGFEFHARPQTGPYSCFCLKPHFWRRLNGQITSTIHNGSEPPEGRLQRHCPRWSIHDQVGDGRCEQSQHHLPHAFNITGKEDWIHPSSRAAVMANRRHLNDPKLTQIQDN